MIKFFGEPWARVAEEWEEVPTPVGEPCSWCMERFIEGDQGICSSNNVPHHRDCFWRRLIGGVNHQLGRCLCCGGNQPSDPPHLTIREAATEAVKLFNSQPQNRNNN